MAANKREWNADRTMPIFSSIRARMTLAFAVSLCAVMLLACLTLTLYAQRTAERNADDVLAAAREKALHELPGNPKTLDLAELNEVKNDITEGHMSLVLLDARGHVTDKAGNTAFSWPIAAAARHDWRIVEVPVGFHTIVIGVPWAQTQYALDRQALVLLLLSLITCASATLGAWVLVGRTLSPIAGLSQQARSASVNAAGLRLSPPSQDTEVVELVATLNDLLARQSEATAARGRFYAAASHELRTPLQALSGHLELALQRPRAGEEYFAVVQEAHVQTRRLTTLVRDLLRLHQLEGDTLAPKEPIALNECCEQNLALFAGLIEQRGLHTQTEMQEAIILSAPTHAQILIRNLIENACKYSVPNGPIHIHVTSMQDDVHLDAVLLEVSNICEETSAWQPDPGFEAFRRPDASRNARTGGNGLGLTICKAIADANGWRLVLNRDNTLVTARVFFAASSIEHSTESSLEPYGS